METAYFNTANFQKRLYWCFVLPFYFAKQSFSDSCIFFLHVLCTEKKSWKKSKTKCHSPPHIFLFISVSKLRQIVHIIIVMIFEQRNFFVESTNFQRSNIKEFLLFNTTPSPLPSTKSFDKTTKFPPNIVL